MMRLSMTHPNEGSVGSGGRRLPKYRDVEKAKLAGMSRSQTKRHYEGAAASNAAAKLAGEKPRKKARAKKSA